MTQLVQLIRRHEETAIGKDGLKLDMPTSEGIARDQERGLRLREQYQGYRVQGVCSQRYRTYAGLIAIFIGMGLEPVDNYIERSQDLNEGDIPPEVRNSPKRRLAGLFEECRDTVIKAGDNLARYLVGEARTYASSTIPPNKLIIAKTHLPPMIAGYLKLVDEPFKIEKVAEYGVDFKAGEGFDLKVEQVGSIYDVIITVGSTERKYELPQLQERIRR